MCLSVSYTFWLLKGLWYDRSQYRGRHVEANRHPQQHYQLDYRLSLRQISEGQTCGRVLFSAPQGTKLGPWLFLLVINDLSIPDIFNMWKYVLGTTIIEGYKKVFLIPCAYFTAVLICEKAEHRYNASARKDGKLFFLYYCLCLFHLGAR